MQQLKNYTKQTNKELSFKIERIVGAVYTVVSYIQKEDPIVHALKLKSLTLLETSVQQMSDRIIEAKEDLTIHLRVAKISGVLSNMNADLLIEAINSLDKLIEDLTPTQYVLPDNFFENTLQYSLPKTTLESLNNKTITNNLLLNTSEILKNKEQNQGYTNKQEEGGKVDKIENLKKIQNYGSQTREISTGKKLDIALKLTRRNTLLKLIKDKGSISTRESVSVIHDCSEKTIQRELNSLVDQGVLKKIGDKRWSKYSLA